MFTPLMLRGCERADIEELREPIDRIIPDAAGPLLASRICMYTNSADGHFIVDHPPAHPNVKIACGFSGHGF